MDEGLLERIPFEKGIVWEQNFSVCMDGCLFKAEEGLQGGDSLHPSYIFT